MASVTEREGMVWLNEGWEEEGVRSVGLPPWLGRWAAALGWLREAEGGEGQVGLV
jgi:hypothetical protein